MSLVNPDLTAQAESLRSQFLNAAPFPHLVIDNFLDPGLAGELLDGFPEFDEALATDESGKVGLKCVHENVTDLGLSYNKLDQLIAGRELRQLVSSMTGIPDLLHDPHYFGGGTHENRSGQDLDFHIDFNYHPITNEHRRLNIILFLNRQWQESWGGSLELCEDPSKPTKNCVSVLPMFNRAVIFATTEHSWHGFRRIESPENQVLSRKSFALYYYTARRPAEESARHHSTVYIERPLPESIRAGQELTEPDLDEIHRLITRRDQHIERLYDNIEELMSELEIQRRSTIMRNARRFVNLATRIRKLFL